MATGTLNPIIGFVGSSNLTSAGLSKQGELNVDVLDHAACLFRECGPVDARLSPYGPIGVVRVDMKASKYSVPDVDPVRPPDGPRRTDSSL